MRTVKTAYNPARLVLLFSIFVFSARALLG